MIPYRIMVMPQAQADILRLPERMQTRMLSRLAWLAAHAETIPHESLHGEAWKGSFRFRIGDYRVIYQLDRADSRLIVLKVGHRRDVYCR